MLAQVDYPTVDTGPFAFGQTRRLKTDIQLWKANPPQPDGTPNPQLLALNSPADELFYGGQAGGGKTDLLLGCAVTQHSHSVIFRRTSPNLKAIVDRSVNILGNACYNKTDKRHDLGGGRFLELGYMQYEDDKTNWQGRPHDFYGFDEPTEITRTQYQFVIGWLRTIETKQRCRVILAGNPPIDEDGLWLVEEFAPWLDPDFYAPAPAGQLRWYYHDDNGRLQWQDTADSVEVNGRSVKPMSRTFIPATLDDNPHLTADGRYEQVLNALPEPLRSAFRDGDFRSMSQQGDPYQIIPTACVRAAQRRWLEREQPEGKPDIAGHDVSRGGQDATTYVPRWGDYVGEVVTWPGRTIPDGPTAALRVHEQAEGNEPDSINVDVIGYGSSSYDSLIGMGYEAVPVNVSVASTYKDKSGKLTMLNLRAELAWRMRDELDPENHSTLALPDDPELLRDLCSVRYVPLAGGKVKAESKDEIKKRIGRSPDKGDAVLLTQRTSLPAFL